MVSKAQIIYVHRLLQDSAILTTECDRNTEFRRAPKIGAFRSGLDGQRENEHMQKVGGLYLPTSGHFANTLHHRIKSHSWNTLLPRWAKQFAKKLICFSISIQEF